METPSNTLNATFQDDKEIQDFLKQIKDAKSQLQLTKDELEQVNTDINKCREEMDRRMMMMVQMDEGLWNSLLELDDLMQEKTNLANHLQEPLSKSIESQQALLRGLQKEESGLVEQEKHLKLRRDDLMKALTAASTNIQEESQGESSSKQASSSQSKSTVNPVKRRAARK